MVSLYVVRHGETLFNRQHKIQGWCDSPLTAQGIAQAQKLNRALKPIPFDHAYCSTSERCIDTAAYILEGRELPLTPCKAFKELNFGEWEGESEEKIFGHDAACIFEKGFAHLGGETIPAMQHRFLNGLEKLVQKHSQGTLLLVTHGGAIMGLLDALQPGIMGKEKGIKNCSVTIITYDGEFTIKCYNQTVD